MAEVPSRPPPLHRAASDATTLHLVPEPTRTSASDSARDSAQGWPPFCTLAELARMLTMMHGHQAPTESSLKKWSAIGEFTACIAPESAALELAPPPAPFTREALLERRGRGRPGRPGLRLVTHLAIRRVYELWPHLADTGSQAVLDLAIARAAESLESRLTHLVTQAPTPAPPPPVAQAAQSAAPSNEILQELLRQMTSLRQDMAEVKREVAQFSAMRNNLITKLDDAVARAQEAIGSGGRAAGGTDPLVEARRDRDMGVVKSMLSEILESLGKR